MLKMYLNLLLLIDTDQKDIEEFRKLLENEGFDTFIASIGAPGVMVHGENLDIFREE